MNDTKGYEQRYSVSLAGVHAINFVRRPVSIPPDEGTVCFADEGEQFGKLTRQCVAVFKGGAWLAKNNQPLPFKPTHWTK